MVRKAVSIPELKKLLAQREKELAKLAARRKRLAGQLEQMEERIAELEGAPAGRGRRKAAVKARRGRPRKARERKTMRQAVAEVLGATRKALGPKEIAEALPVVGYVSRSKNLVTMVGQVLSGNPEFRRVARGKYRLDRRRRAGKAAKKGKKAVGPAEKKSES